MDFIKQLRDSTKRGVVSLFLCTGTKDILTLAFMKYDNNMSIQQQFTDTALKHTLGSRLLTACSIFLADSLDDILVWLIVMFSVILCDFIAGSRKSILMGDYFRISKALRATMGKMCTYFSFVIAAVFIEQASHINSLAKWAIIIVCAGEGISIINNILIPKGYSIDIKYLLSAIGSKFGKIDNAGNLLKEQKKQNIKDDDSDGGSTGAALL